ncbi:MAG: hypothetical protein KGJ78_12750 [Alphaproteobacteria bacterium]|nr:hypothetical protein [Alphaproteobacteria bacterium]
MQLTRKALNARWAWTSATAVGVLVVLNLADSYLRARTGYGTADLQGISTGWGLRLVIDRWTSPPDAAIAGFVLGFDYLFMPLYAVALYCGGIIAAERFAPPPGRAHRIITFLAAAPIAAALFDACENGLQIYMLLRSPTDMLAALAAEATAAKFAGIAIGLVMTLAALIGLVWKRKPRR